MDIDMTQINTRRTTLTAVMRSAAFVRGFKEAQNGVAMDYDAFTTPRETTQRWNYERGRQFGFIFDGALKNGAAVRHEALLKYAGALHLNWVR